MTNQSPNTRNRPSDIHPECPDCETDVFVDAEKSPSPDYRCQFCGTGWNE